MFTRRQLVLAATSALAPLSTAWAEDYPNPAKPIRFVVPVSAGSGTDLIARYLADGLRTLWKGATLVENRVGASGVIGTDAVAKSPPDGYTLLATYAAHYSNTWTMDKIPYDAVKDFTPVVTLANASLVMIVAADSPFKTVGDVIEAARKNPGELTYGTAGVGSTGHVCAALFTAATGVKLRHVPYKSASQPIIDTAGGQVNMSFAGTPSSMPLIKGGRLRALATTGLRRSTMLPDVPTMLEAGVKDYEVSSPVWIMAPAGTPPDIVNRLSTALLTYARMSQFSDLVAPLGMNVDIEDAATAGRKAAAEHQKWKNLMALTAS